MNNRMNWIVTFIRALAEEDMLENKWVRELIKELFLDTHIT